MPTRRLARPIRGRPKIIAASFRRAPQFDGTIKQIPFSTADCGGGVIKSSNHDHIGALMSGERQGVPRLTCVGCEARGDVCSSRCGSVAVGCGCAQDRRQGSSEGGLAVAVAATPGTVRIGRDSAYRSLFPAVSSSHKTWLGSVRFDRLRSSRPRLVGATPAAIAPGQIPACSGRLLIRNEIEPSGAPGMTPQKPG